MGSEFHGIPIVSSGQKYTTPKGHSAILDGMKVSRVNEPGIPKPDWLRTRANISERFQRTQTAVHDNHLATVCEESHCPNMSECWSHGTATIMIMGRVCTRACKFCAVDTGNPHGWLDSEEPNNVAQAVALMNLKYVVLTSVDRDDLCDGGAAHYAACVQAIRKRCPDTIVEALAPDFDGVLASVRKLADSGIAVFSQNVETVQRLTYVVRDHRAGYAQTLDVLGEAKRHHPGLLTKTSLMLGLGEQHEEVVQMMCDARRRNIDILTLGQYLRPTQNHLPVDRYVKPAEFDSLRRLGLSMGFLEVAAGPMVRSSYRADQVFQNALR